MCFEYGLHMSLDLYVGCLLLTMALLIGGVEIFKGMTKKEGLGHWSNPVQIPGSIAV